MAKITDGFSQADENPLSSSGAWSTYSGLTNLQVVSNRVRAASLGGTDALQTRTASIGGAQYGRVKIPAIVAPGGGNESVGVLLRYATPNTNTGYQCFGGVVSAVRAAIAEVTAGSYSNLVTDTTTTWAAGDELIAYAHGSQINLFRLSGGTLTRLLEAIDTTITTGRVGLQCWNDTGALSGVEVDDFEGGDLPISRIATGTFATGSGATLTVTIPGGGAAGDLALLFIVGRPTGTVEITTVSNGFAQVPSATSLVEAGTNDCRVQVFSKVLVGGDANPVITVPSSWQGTTAGIGAAIGIWRGINTTTPFDATSVASSAAAADTWQQTGLTTVTDWALVVSFVGTSDDNALSLGASPAVPRGFSPLMSGASFDEATNVGDFSMGVADFIQPTAGTPAMPTWDQTLVGTDPWAGIALALRPVSTAVAAEFAATVSLTVTTGVAVTTTISLTGAATATLTTAAAALTAPGALVRHTALGPHGVPLGRAPLPGAELAAAASLVVTTTAELTAPGATLVAAVSASVTATGALTTSIPLAGAATGSATTAGALTTVIRFAGASTATATTTGVLTTVIRAAGAATATLTTAGSLTTAIPLVGASTATLTSTGALTTVIGPRGTASLVLNAQGALQTEIRLAATAQLVLTTQPTMAGTSANFAATPSLTVTATGSLTTVIRAAGTATLTVTTSPVLTTVIPLAGAATATLTTVPAALTTPTGFRAAATATLTAMGGLTTQIRMAGTASLVLTTAGQIGSEALLASAVQLRITTAGDIATALLLASQVTATLAAAGALTTAITLVGESALLVTAIGDFTVTVQPAGDGWIFHVEPPRTQFTVPESDHVARVLVGAHVFEAKDQGDET